MRFLQFKARFYCPFQRHQNYVPSLCSCREKWLSFYRSRFFTPSKNHFLSSSSKFSVRGRYRAAHKNKLEFLADIPDRVTFLKPDFKKCLTAGQSWGKVFLAGQSIVYYTNGGYLGSK